MKARVVVGKLAMEVARAAIYRGRSPRRVVAMSWVPSPTESKIPSRFDMESYLTQFSVLCLFLESPTELVPSSHAHERVEFRVDTSTRATSSWA
jgi:hypothetical protein